MCIKTIRRVCCWTVARRNNKSKGTKKRGLRSAARGGDRGLAGAARGRGLQGRWIASRGKYVSQSRRHNEERILMPRARTVTGESVCTTVSGVASTPLLLLLLASRRSYDRLIGLRPAIFWSSLVSYIFLFYFSIFFLSFFFVFVFSFISFLVSFPLAFFISVCPLYRRRTHGGGEAEGEASTGTIGPRGHAYREIGRALKRTLPRGRPSRDDDRSGRRPTAHALTSQKRARARDIERREFSIVDV